MVDKILMQHKPGIFRSVSTPTKEGESATRTLTTMRPPLNVPFLVDNLWEWQRPIELACRRTSAFASPSVSLAQDNGPKNGLVYRVELTVPFKLCQLIGWKDSKYHSDCKSLPKLLLKRLGQEWVDSGMASKLEAGRLWMPCITATEVESLFQSVPGLQAIREDIAQAVTYWQNVSIVESPDLIPDLEGELFFEAPSGYKLTNLMPNPN